MGVLWGSGRWSANCGRKCGMRLHTRPPRSDLKDRARVGAGGSRGTSACGEARKARMVRPDTGSRGDGMLVWMTPTGLDRVGLGQLPAPRAPNPFSPQTLHSTRVAWAASDIERADHQWIASRELALAPGPWGAEIANERGGYSRRLPDLVFRPARDRTLRAAVVVAPGLCNPRRERAALQGWQRSILVGQYAQVHFIRETAAIFARRRERPPRCASGRRCQARRLPTRPARRSRTQAAIALLDIVAPPAQPAGTSGQSPHICEPDFPQGRHTRQALRCCRDVILVGLFVGQFVSQRAVSGGS